MTNNILKGVVVVLCFISVYTIFVQKRAVKHIREITVRMNNTLDSLETINHKYEALESEYLLTYQKLSEIRSKVEVTKKELDALSTNNVNSVKVIKSKINSLIEEIELNEHDSTANEGFRFK